MVFSLFVKLKKQLSCISACGFLDIQGICRATVVREKCRVTCRWHVVKRHCWVIFTTFWYCWMNNVLRRLCDTIQTGIVNGMWSRHLCLLAGCIERRCLQWYVKRIKKGLIETDRKSTWTRTKMVETTPRQLANISENLCSVFVAMMSKFTKVNWLLTRTILWQWKCRGKRQMNNQYHPWENLSFAFMINSFGRTWWTGLDLCASSTLCKY